MKLILGVLLVLLATTPVAASGDDATRAGIATVTNLGLATTLAEVDAGHVAFSVDEAAQDGVDLNGDGDAMDRVLHVHDTVAPATTNLGLATGFLPHVFHGDYLVFWVEEAEQGATDLNGDGDASDRVLHVRDMRTGAVRNAGLAGGFALVVGEGHVALQVDEAQQGSQDLNGDGDALDSVVHLVDLERGTVDNLGLAGYPGELREGRLGLRVDESSQGSTDLNGDGDTLDFVYHVRDLDLGTTVNLRLAGYSTALLRGDLAALGVDEHMQGDVDLNGDGDLMDEVQHIHDLAGASTTNLGLASFGFATRWADSTLAFLVGEYAQGMTDLNGDGDAFDLVVHVHDGATVNLGLGTMGEPSLLTDGRRIAFLVGEDGQGMTDLNGDGDAFDFVAHFHDPVRRVTTNLGLAGATMSLRGHRLALGVDEYSQGGIDLNGDGDAVDMVVHVVDVARGGTTNLGRAGFVGFGPSEALFSVLEYQQGVDLNGDGDLLDQVGCVHDPFTGATQELGLAGYYAGFDEGLQLLLVSENDQGATDLNGDGDAFDTVLHLVAPTYPFGLETDGDTFSVAAGGVQRFELDAGSNQANRLHLLVGSLAGTKPGLFVQGFTLPLNYDAYLYLTLTQPNQPPIADSFGVLDARGEQRATFALPPAADPVLIGLTAHHAFAAIDASTLLLTFVSNPSPLVFVP
jgi:hypothetical protein